MKVDIIRLIKPKMKNSNKTEITQKQKEKRIKLKLKSHKDKRIKQIKIEITKRNKKTIISKFIISR